MPTLPDGWVQVRTRFSAISRGTEGIVFRGEVPASEHGRMRAPFQEGEFPAPVKYGYINAGVVELGPAALIGRAVYCLYPHQTCYQVPADAVHPLPDGLAPGRAVLAANLEAAINGLWDAAARIGDRITVVGGGTLGCLVAWLAARLPGCRVELVDTNPERAPIAKALGARFRLPAAATPDADLVIHASGAPDGLTIALDLAGFEARILELSWFGSKSATLPLGQAFHQRRLTLRSSQVGSVAACQRARWDHRRRLALALSLLTDDRLELLITGEDPFSALPQVQSRLAADPGNTLLQRIRYD